MDLFKHKRFPNGLGLILVFISALGFFVTPALLVLCACEQNSFVAPPPPKVEVGVPVQRGITHPAIGADFDPKTFVDTLKKSHVDSITIFAKCHHGWSYYPTRVGKPHPHLARRALALLRELARCAAARLRHGQ